MSRRTALALAIVVALVLIALGLRLWLSSRRGGEGLAGLFDIFPREDRLVLEPASFSDLTGWQTDALEEAIPAMIRSCDRIAPLPDDAPVDDEPFAGKAGDWREACTAARSLPPGDRAAARRFFENRFQPWAARNNRNPLGLFTGYYEPLLHGSRKQGGKHTVPIYMRPPELVMVDLGRFREDLEGKRLAGQVVNGDLVPYPDRRQIEAGALAGRQLEIVWVDDPIDAFFLHVQGSGRVQLAEGGEVRIGYAAQNGHPYTAIARELIERGAFSREQASMQSIRAWLEAHPDQIRPVLDKDASYIFFQEIKGDGPLGAEGVPLTPERSLAVDLKYLPLGVPLWLVCGAPSPREGEPDRKIERLMMAQDTGGAIRGPVRGDFFWGFGDEAEAVAGRMKHRGRYWLLLPKTVRP
ncbi:MAG TPA: MltA domain-containing protein [Thermoanaerobaculia bacterium]|nr:MltA domain-containing protein [Thermoanaerobaculia bacterium]